MSVFSRPSVKLSLSLGIIIATFVSFWLYLRQHPEYITQLGRTRPLTIAILIGINTCLIAVLAAIYSVTLRLIGVTIPQRENILLTIYSSIANFFGPLQSGPGVRAAYLRAKHAVKLKDYTTVTLVYYAVYACISALFLFIGTRPWWQTALFFLAVAALSIYVLRRYRKRTAPRKQPDVRWQPLLLAGLAALTLLQLSLVAIRYTVELAQVGAHASVGQSISYAGAANFALFVSITPDGIGIRESFLLASQRLHGITTPHIVASSLLDRASYIAFLGLLFVCAVILHARQKLFRTSSARP